MEVRKISPFISVSPQLQVQDIGVAASQGFKVIINNRPDGEEDGQPSSDELKAAAQANGLEYIHIPVIPGKVTDKDVEAFSKALDSVRGPVLAFCRTGTRSSTLWALSVAPRLDTDAILQTTAEAGYDLSALRPKIEARAAAASANAPAAKKKAAGEGATAGKRHQVVIVGGGAGGISVASSMLRRQPGLDIVIIEPRDKHYYQPGWTLVGGGVFDRAQTEKPMSAVIPDGVRWIRAAAAGFAPETNEVILEDGERIGYRVLVVAPGLKLNWEGVEGLKETLGKNGVTSNYLFDLAPYTWELVQNLREGVALFTQPPMPIKCAGAPQKAMYLACDHWRRSGRLDNIEVAFHNAGGVLFGVPDYVPALMRYVDRYGIDLRFNQNLKAIDGPARKAWFTVTKEDGSTETVERSFDMIHVCPPQCAPDFIRESPLANEAGWVDVDPETLQHTKFGNIFSLGDAGSTPNAKTAAAVRKQAPVVAVNALEVLAGQPPRAVYDGYGSCPLTVERGKIVLAEFGYGGKLLPTFPFLDGTRPSSLAWFLKEKMLPPIYWHAMLEGHEWLAAPTILPHRPTAHEASPACGPDLPKAP